MSTSTVRCSWCNESVRKENYCSVCGRPLTREAQLKNIEDKLEKILKELRSGR